MKAKKKRTKNPRKINSLRMPFRLDIYNHILIIPIFYLIVYTIHTDTKLCASRKLTCAKYIEVIWKKCTKNKI